MAAVQCTRCAVVWVECQLELTFNEINIKIVVIPRTVSLGVKWPMFLTIFVHVSINSFPPLPGRPSRDLIWLLEIVNAAAVVNPTITGMETKSTRKPMDGVGGVEYSEIST